MARCWFQHDFQAFEEESDDGGYIQGLRCSRCGASQVVAKVSKRGAELQLEIQRIRKQGRGLSGLDEFNRLLREFQREVTRL